VKFYSSAAKHLHDYTLRAIYKQFDDSETPLAAAAYDAGAGATRSRYRPLETDYPLIAISGSFR